MKYVQNGTHDPASFSHWDDFDQNPLKGMGSGAYDLILSRINTASNCKCNQRTRKLFSFCWLGR
jgi:hypothetical protein